jgi:shikimate kinase
VSNLYLVGFMGVGKTQAGRALAGQLGRSFVDLDERIEDRLGRSIRELFERRGEAAFRQAEFLELERLAARADLVVATGGGTFCSPSNRELIHRSGGVSVFLDPPWTVIHERLGEADSQRPMWVDGDHARGLFLERLPAYRAAMIRIALDGSEDPDTVARRIATVVRESACAI